jgi:CheY-like chemotaxis protein
MPPRMIPDDAPIHIIDDLTPPEQRLGTPWRVLVVDDNQSVLEFSELVLVGLEVERRRVTLHCAASAADAMRVLEECGHETFALALIDVVMEDDTAGLRLVEHIRTTLGNRLMRLILRSGVSGWDAHGDFAARFDLDGCHLKSDLRRQRLIDLVTGSLQRWHGRAAIGGGA